MDVVFRVVDSGKGMSEDFQKNCLFVPFMQADSFQPGTGLGLSIVKQIIDSLGGTIDIKSVQDVGTEVEVRLSLALADSSTMVDEEITAVVAKTKGLRLALLDPNGEKERDSNDNISRLDTTLSEVCWGWFEMEVTKADSMKDVDADVYMYTEPPSVEYLLEHHSVNKTGSEGGRGKEVPLVIVCLNASEAVGITANHIKVCQEHEPTPLKLTFVVDIVRSRPNSGGHFSALRAAQTRQGVKFMRETYGRNLQRSHETRKTTTAKRTTTSVKARGHGCSHDAWITEHDSATTQHIRGEIRIRSSSRFHP
jgi:hypothetical protein